MKMKAKMLHPIGIVFVVLFSVICLTHPTEVAAKAKVVDIEGINYDVNTSISNNLKSLMGKKVYVTLNSGKVFSGYVKEVGKKLIHLEKLDGKDFFDALIQIQNISAIDTRFRDYQR